MYAELKRILAMVDADYADLRYETRKDARITYEGPELRGLSSCAADGYVLRVLIAGGFSSVAFTRPEDAPRAVAKAVADARVLARMGRKPTSLAKVPVVKDSVKPILGVDPESRTMDEKAALLARYNGLALASPRVATTNLAYFELTRDRFFASSEGSEVDERLVTVGISGSIVSREGSLIQNIRCAIGGSDGYQNLEGKDDYFRERARLVGELLDAEPVRGGRYSVVLNPSMAGLFTHEAFGHFSEADIIEDLPSMRDKMKLGERLGSAAVTIIDDPTKTGVLGHYRYDDEGVAAKRVTLMEGGVLKGRLHSRRTAAAFGDEPNGHAVAEDYRYAPMVRMGTIYLEPRPAQADASLEALLARAEDGIYVLDAKGGETAGRSFSFGAQYGYEIKGGKLGRMVRDINISGDLYESLANIEAVGSDFSLAKAGGCGKGQLNIRSCHGGAPALFRNLVVGGV